jgi:hypothetical protein
MRILQNRVMWLLEKIKKGTIKKLTGKDLRKKDEPIKINNNYECERG